MDVAHHEVEDLITNLRPRHVTLNTDGGKIYWGITTDRGFGEIQRANLDGSEVEVLVTDLFVPASLVLNAPSGKIYWTDGGRVRRANLDGSEVEVLITNLRGPRHITLDVDGGKMYWFASWFISEFSTEIAGKIQRANLDGSEVEDLVVNLEVPGSLALDVVNGKMYWTYFSNSSTQIAGKIQRANLDGSEVADLVPDSQAPHSLSLFLVD